MISLVVPVFNSASGLLGTFTEIESVMSASGLAYELILVDDGSRDGSWETILAICAKSPQARGIRLMRNFGQHNALLAGIRAARGDTVVTLDDDLQHPPSEVPKLLSALAPSVDVVYGVPKHLQHGLLRNAASWVTKLVLQRAMGADTARRISAFRVFRTQLREGFADFRGPFVSLDVLLTWSTSRFSHLVVRHDDRKFGTSNYTVYKLLVHTLNMVTGFSTLPLQFASFLGFAAMIVGLGILSYVLFTYFVLGWRVPGFTFLASSIALFSGVQLFSIGMIGEYLARMHFRVMDKPPYAVKDTQEGSHENP